MHPCRETKNHSRDFFDRASYYQTVSYYRKHDVTLFLSTLMYYSPGLLTKGESILCFILSKVMTLISKILIYPEKIPTARCILLSIRLKSTACQMHLNITCLTDYQIMYSFDWYWITWLICSPKELDVVILMVVWNVKNHPIEDFYAWNAINVYSFCFLKTTDKSASFEYQRSSNLNIVILLDSFWFKTE